MTENLALLDRPTTPDRLDYRAINAKALKHWPAIKDLVMDWHGRAVGEVARLNPAYVATDPSKRRSDGPRLVELRGPSVHDGGSWHSLANGASGPDVISLIEFLSQAPRPVAAEWLGRIVDRIAIVEAA
jgi:hypothetical protein